MTVLMATPPTHYGPPRWRRNCREGPGGHKTAHEKNAELVHFDGDLQLMQNAFLRLVSLAPHSLR